MEAMPLPPLDALDTPALEALVRQHNGLYWDDDAPELSDPEFDRLVTWKLVYTTATLMLLVGVWVYLARLTTESD